MYTWSGLAAAAVVMRRPGAQIVCLIAPLFAVSAFAAGASEESFPWAMIIVACVGSSGAGALAVHLITLRAQRGEREANVDNLQATAQKHEAEALSTSAGTIADLFAQLRAAIKEADALRVDIRAATERGDRFEAELRQLREYVTRVEEIAAAALAANRIDDIEDFRDMWDLVTFPVAFTRTGDGGHWELVNEAWPRLLGCRREDLLGTGWQAFLHPDDREITLRGEEAARYRRVWGFSNRFVTVTGEVITYDWFAAAYKKDRTVAFAIPRKDGSPSLFRAPALPAVRSPRLHVKGERTS